MEDKITSKVAAVLGSWNPLCEKANTVDGLDGYRIEAIDILSTINMMSGRDKIARAISQVLSQAFHIDIEPEGLKKAEKKIADIIKES